MKTLEEIKQALVEVRDICRDNRCIKCPFSKTYKEYGVVDCRLARNLDEWELPYKWDVDDWKEQKDG